MAGVTDGNNWEANLGALGKLERGDMLAKAGSDGKLVRKTNWLTQATNKSKTHDDDLFKQIEEVLNFAETKIDVDPEGQAPLIKQYIQANKGLEILLSTYRSKGSKEAYLIDKLTLLLANHVVNYETKNRDADPNIQTLKKHAEQAIKFVNDCRIRSVNNIKKMGWGNPYFGIEYDKRLFSLLVRGASGTKIGGGGRNLTVKDLKSAVASIVRRPISRREKKQLLAEYLDYIMTPNVKNYKGEEKGLDWLTGFKNVDGKNTCAILKAPYQPLTVNKNKNHIKPEEVQRIKIAKRAIRTRFGNCYDKAAVAATHLIENTKGKIHIVWVGGYGENHYDHSWVLISKDDRIHDALEAMLYKKSPDGDYKKLFPKDTWVVDGWTRDWWQLRAWFNTTCNVRQLGVRHKIRKAIKEGKISSKENVTWPPQPTMAWFRLRFAHLAALDWNMVQDTGDMKWEDFQNAITILKNCRNELTQIFENNLVQDVIDDQNIESLVDEISEGHNSARPVSAEIKISPSRISAKKSAHNSLDLRVSIRSSGI